MKDDDKTPDKESTLDNGVQLENEIVIYQPDSTLSIDVRIEGDTVWLNRNQMSCLFDRDVKTIGKHINSALREELEGQSTVAKFATVQKEGERIVTRNVEYYNLDVILSVGYRVKSKRGVQFRVWANKILKEYLLKGYSVNQRLVNIEDRIDRRLIEHDKRLDELTGKVDFFIRTSMPPMEGLFFDGQIFDAYALISDLIRSARKRVILIDNYVDDRVLRTLDKRGCDVTADIFTDSRKSHITQDLKKHNAQYPEIKLHDCKNVHDRFLIVDDAVYLFGGSIKDLGKKIVGFSMIHFSPDYILSSLGY